MGIKKQNIKKSVHRVTKQEGLTLFRNADLLGLGMMADKVRHRKHPEHIVTFVVDRNINYTNVCINRCAFCAFWRDERDPEAYVLTKRALFNKIRQTLALGGTQILIQGGLHPGFNINYYLDLLKSVKEKFPIHVHGFSPPEICYITDKEGFTLKKTLKLLREAGLDSIPGGGAEILSDGVRKKNKSEKNQQKQMVKSNGRGSQPRHENNCNHDVWKYRRT